MRFIPISIFAIAVFSALFGLAVGQCNCPLAFCCSPSGNCGLGAGYCGRGCRGGPCYELGGNDCNCGTRCCSQWGYCGTGSAYCGAGCRSGSCYGRPSRALLYGLNVSNIVTQDFFNGIASQADANCAGKGFYTREAFLTAAESFPQFASWGSANDSAREIAAFFAHATHETNNLCQTEEASTLQNGKYCDQSYTQYPCNDNKEYHGRGPLKMSWNFNYGPAGKSIGFDGLNAPETVSKDNVISFKTALWYWVTKARESFVTGKGFGSTIQALKDSTECNGANPDAVANRVALYVKYCNQLNVDPGTGHMC